MKRFMNLLAAAVLAAGVIALPVFATVKADDRIVVREDEVINDDFFAAGEEVTIEGTVNGDVYAGAQRVNIRGTVNGDVIAGAATIEVSGTIKDDLRVGGNTISLIGATIGDSVSVGGNELSIDSDTKIGGGVLFGGRSLTLDGSVARGLMAGVETVRIGGLVGLDANVAANSIVLGDGGEIGGDFEYHSEEEPEINGIVGGEVIKGSGRGINLDAEVALRQLAIGFNVWAFISALVVAGAMLLLMPKLFVKGDKALRSKPWQTVGWGAVALLATIPAVFVLFITVFGIPLGILTLLLWMVAIYLAKIFAAYSIGGWIVDYFKGKKGQTNVFLATLVGLLLYYGLRMVPYIGMPVRLATTLIGLGIIITLLVGRNPKKKPATSAN